MVDVYENLKQKMLKICGDRNLLDETVRVRTRVLTTEEAIGNPEAHDFPLQKGKERLMQAKFRGAAGQAFTDRYGGFEGVLEEILKMNLENNFRRAVFVSAMNAVLRHLGRIDKTVHCRDQEPAECAKELASHIRHEYGQVKIALVGFQPRMVESLASQFPVRVLDLDEDNIGARKFGVPIEGPQYTEETVDWADLLAVTGTTLVNGSIGSFMREKPLILYGTTIAGAAHLMGWKRFCVRGH
ncbi:MAG: DUF364 domain-containing protein [Thermodesulfobacteriota bacterium]